MNGKKQCKDKTGKKDTKKTIGTLIWIMHLMSSLCDACDVHSVSVRICNSECAADSAKDKCNAFAHSTHTHTRYTCEMIKAEIKTDAHIVNATTAAETAEITTEKNVNAMFPFPTVTAFGVSFAHTGYSRPCERCVTEMFPPSKRPNFSSRRDWGRLLGKKKHKKRQKWHIKSKLHEHFACDSLHAKCILCTLVGRAFFNPIFECNTSNSHVMPIRPMIAKWTVYCSCLSRRRQMEKGVSPHTLDSTRKRKKHQRHAQVFSVRSFETPRVWKHMQACQA